MSVIDQEKIEQGTRNGQSSWPVAAQQAIALLETNHAPLTERRARSRRRYRSTARFWIAAEKSTTIYLRDVGAWGLGFICNEQLEAGTKGTVRLPLPDGTLIRVVATVTRGREFGPGWYEGAMHFTREQDVFI